MMNGQQTRSQRCDVTPSLIPTERFSIHSLRMLSLRDAVLRVAGSARLPAGPHRQPEGCVELRRERPGCGSVEPGAADLAQDLVLTHKRRFQPAGHAHGALAHRLAPIAP